MVETKRFTTAVGVPVADNTDMSAGPRGPALPQDVWLIEKLAHFDREVIPERLLSAQRALSRGAASALTAGSRGTCRASTTTKVEHRTKLAARQRIEP